MYFFLDRKKIKREDEIYIDNELYIFFLFHTFLHFMDLCLFTQQQHTFRFIVLFYMVTTIHTMNISADSVAESSTNLIKNLGKSWYILISQPGLSVLHLTIHTKYPWMIASSTIEYSIIVINRRKIETMYDNLSIKFSDFLLLSESIYF